MDTLIDTKKHVRNSFFFFFDRENFLQNQINSVVSTSLKEQLIIKYILQDVPSQLIGTVMAIAAPKSSNISDSILAITQPMLCAIR